MNLQAENNIAPVVSYNDPNVKLEDENEEAVTSKFSSQAYGEEELPINYKMQRLVRGRLSAKHVNILLLRRYGSTKNYKNIIASYA